MPFRSVSEDTTENFFGNSDAVITTPAGAIVGDSLIGFIGVASQTLPNTPTGWTFEGSTTDTLGGNGPTIGCYSRTAQDAGGGSPPATYTFDWGGVNQTGIMGCILAYDTAFLGTHHYDGNIVNNVIDADHYTHDIPVHSVAATATVLYGYYVAQRNVPVVTVPAASTQRANGLWLPADLGGTFTRGALVVGEEIVSGSSEPAASFAVTWNHGFFGPVPDNGMSCRAVLMGSGATPAVAYDFWG